ncbi:hypothetical protein [Alloactinosynnema sp. L-07]|nr:hypothetical protein [Alloactinosynnema sp. L-07]
MRQQAIAGVRLHAPVGRPTRCSFRDVVALERVHVLGSP